MTGGYASINGGSGGFLGGGLDLGIPLDRLRRWEAVLGANATFLSGSDSAGLPEFLEMPDKFIVRLTSLRPPPGRG